MQNTLKSGLVIALLSISPSVIAANAVPESLVKSAGLLASSESLENAAETEAQTIALGGYDPTQYFAGGLPKRGDASISYEFEGQLYYFTSYQNRQQFIANPTAFAPQYGGQCAFAVAEHKTMVADPSVFTVEDGKLFLFQNEEKLEMWKTNSRKFRLLADKRWEFEAKNLSKFSAKF